MLRCKEVTTMLAAEELEFAGWPRRIAVRLHLLMCKHCRRYASQLKAIGAAAWNLFRSISDKDAKTILRLEKAILSDLPDATPKKPSPGRPKEPPSNGNTN